jgi:hypothetical protein
MSPRQLHPVRHVPGQYAGGVATAIFVVLLVVAIAAANALVWIPIVLWFRRKRTASLGVLAADLADSGERTVRGPERALYRGGTGSYSAVGGNGFLQLTDRRLIFVKLTGGRVDVERSQVASVDEERVFLGKVRGGRTHVVITTISGWQIGFIVADPAAWVETLRPVAG